MNRRRKKVQQTSLRCPVCRTVVAVSDEILADWWTLFEPGMLGTELIDDVRTIKPDQRKSSKRVVASLPDIVTCPKCNIARKPSS